MELTHDDLVAVTALVTLLNENVHPEGNSEITVANVQVWSVSGDQLGKIDYSAGVAEYVFRAES